MLSRVADSIYWVGRYVERAENIARFIDVNCGLSIDLPRADSQQWEPLVATMGDSAAFVERYRDFNQKNVLEFLTFDRSNPNAIASCVHAARENARAIREIISTEMWEQVNGFYHMINDESFRRQALAEPYELYRQVKTASQHFVGITDATMSHNAAWHCCRMGRLIECADKTSRIVDVKYYILLPGVQDVDTAFDDVQWTALLRSAGAFEMYRQRYGTIDRKRIVDFLLLDREFPRAARYCLSAALYSMRAVTRSYPGTFSNPAEQRLGQLCAALDYVHIDEIFNRGLHEYIDDFQHRLNGVGSSIQHALFGVGHTDS